MDLQPQIRKNFWHLFLIFLVLSLGILGVGYFYYKHQAAHIKQDKQNDLVAITNLKIRQIDTWRQERLGDAQVIFSDHFLARQIKDCLQGNASPALKQEVMDRLAALRFYHYQKIILIGPQGEVEMAFPSEKRACDSYSQRLVAEARQRKEIIFSDLYRDDVTREIRLSLLIPVLPAGAAVPVAVILLKIDPHLFLYPLIQSWPTPSRTGETLLLHREGDEVVYLNELRHRQDSALRLRLPLNTPKVCSAMLAQGAKGVIEGADYEGRPVLAAGDRIPDSPWFLLAKVDQREIFAPISDFGRQAGVMVLGLLASASLGFLYVWRNQQAAFYRRQFETERQKLTLGQRYAYVTQYANDIILLAADDLRLLEANDRAVESYGYKKDELLQLALPDLQPPEARSLLAEKLRQTGDSEGALFETDQQRRDGTVFPVEISLRRLELEGQQVYQAIIRDVTRRRRAQETLQRREADLAEAQRIAHLGHWEYDLVSNKVFWSDEVFRIFGLEPQESVPTRELFYSFIHPEDLAAVEEIEKEAFSSGKYGPYDYRIIRRDGSIRFLSSLGESRFDPEGRPLRLMGTTQDITERQQAEEALKESEERLRQLASQLLVAQEEERRRLAVTLHDDLGQALMVFRFQLSAIRDKLRPDHQPLSRDCEEMLAHLDGVLQRVRQVSQDLNPPGVLADLGFQAALGYLVEEFGKLYAIRQNSLEVADIEPLFSRRSQVIIYRIFQEALTNIGRHAQASRVSIAIKKQRAQVSFTIQDDGRGFVKQQVLGKKATHCGIGLSAMQERVKMLGGTLQIRSRKDEGTRISFVLPVENK